MPSAALAFGGRLISAGGFTLARPKTDYHWSREAYGWLEPVLAYTMAQGPVMAVGLGVSTDPSFFGGALPTAATDIIVPEGSKLTILAGDLFAFNRMFIYGEVEVLGALPPAVTTVTFDTIAVMPGGKLVSREVGGNKVDFVLRVETDIDIAQDPWRVSRGLVVLGECEIVGRPRQYIIPVSHDILAGQTTQLTLTLTPFLGRDGPAGDGEFNYTAWDLDWAPGEKLILPGVQPRLNSSDGHKSEIVEISAVNLIENATNFSAKDTTGSTITLNAPAVVDHTKYWDQAALDIINPSFGPAPGSQTEGSHVNFFGLPFVLNPNRNIRFLMTDPAAPVHRRGYIGVHSSATRIEWAERQRLGRSSLLLDTVLPTEGPITATTNLRHQHSMSVYDAGHTYFDDVKAGKNCVRTVGSVAWSNGSVGAAINDIGGGSAGSGFAQINSSVYYEANISDNTIGAGINVYTSNDMGKARHNVASCTWSEFPFDGNNPFFKDLDDYGREDTGRDGSAYYTVSRTFEWTRNFALGYKNAGRVILSRSRDISETFLSKFMPDGPEQARYEQFAGGTSNDDRPRLVINGDYFSGGDAGSIISKNGPSQRHGWRSHIKDCVYLDNRRYGAFYEYTGNYHLDRHIILGAQSLVPNNRGLFFGSSVYGFVSNGFFIANYNIGVRAVKADASGPQRPDNEVDFKFIDFKPMRNVATQWDNITADGPEPEVITLNEDYSGPFGFNITQVDTSQAGLVVYRGVVRDPLGEYPYVFATPEIDAAGLEVPFTQNYGAFVIHGYYTNSGAGEPLFSYYKLVAMDRLNADRFLEVLFPLPAGGLPTFEPWRHPSDAQYELENLGSRDFTAELAAANAIANNGEVFP